jgi:membrane fusion protein, multidrug efflux system
MNTAENADIPPNGKRRRILLIVATVFIVVGIAWLLYWLLVLSVRERTDDAYVNGNKVVVSSQVPGTVVAIAADDNQLVTAGQILVRLDPTDAESAVNRAASALAQAVRQIRQQSATADQYSAAIESRRLELARAQADVAHREPLIKEQAIAPEELRHAREAVAMAQAALQQTLRQAQAARALVDNTDVRSNPAVLEAKALYRDAWVSAKRNGIIAPVTGYVAERSVQLGQRIAPGQSLMSVIPLHEVWVDANYKEVQLRHLRIGQPALVDADLYGSGQLFHGHISGMAAGTGAAFALLPAQNATGNWIKVVQRVPVRITLDPQELSEHPLRIGLSCTVTVDTHDRSGTVLARAAQSGHVDTELYSGDLDKASAEADAIIDRNIGKNR